MCPPLSTLSTFQAPNRSLASGLNHRRQQALRRQGQEQPRSAERLDWHQRPPVEARL